MTGRVGNIQVNDGEGDIQVNEGEGNIQVNEAEINGRYIGTGK